MFVVPLVAKVSQWEHFDNGRAMGERESDESLSRDTDSRELESRIPESRETAATTRSHNVVHYVQRDLDQAARVLNGLGERSAAQETGPEVVVMLPTADDALSLSQAVRSNRHSGGRALTPITSLTRGRRLLASGAKAIAASPAELAALIRESRLPLAAVHTLVLVWPEEMLTGDQRDALESVMAEVPKAIERVAVCASRTPDLAQFLERAMWRARTFDHVEAGASTGPVIRVLTAVPAEQVRALRSVIDAFDPETAVLVTFSDEGEAAAREAVSVLGGDDALLSVSRGSPEGHFKLGIIFDDAPPAADLTAIRLAADELVAIVRPVRLAALQKVAGDTTPFVWTGALASARSAQDALRDEIRGTAASGAHLPWVSMLEPLLDQLDPVDVAGAALSILDRDRRRAKKVAPTVSQAIVAERPVREGRPPAFGSKRPGGREESRGDRPSAGGGFKKSRPGAWDAGRGQVRRDDERRGPRREASDRPRRDAGDRPRRDEGRDRPPRRDEGRDRPPGRRDDIERVPRAAHEGREWSERGDRLRNSRRGGPRTRDGA